VTRSIPVGPALFAVLGALALAACGDGGKAAAPKRVARTPKVGEMRAPTRDLVYAVAAVGTLEAHQVVDVPARVEGPVEALGFEEGKPVGTSTTLAVVDGTRRDLLLGQATKAVDRAVATVERLRSAVGKFAAQESAAKAGLVEQQGMLARRESARAKAPGLVTDEEIEAVRAEIAKAQARVEEAAASAKEAEAAVREAEAALAEARGREAVAKRDADDARIRPPLAGIAQARHVVVGQWVRAGDRIVTLVDASRLRLRFRVPETESVALVPGRVGVRFRVAALAGRELSADLLYVQGSADPVTRMVECLAEVKDLDPALKPGFFASVSVDVKSAAAAVILPEEAVLPTERGLIAFAITSATGADGKETKKAVPTPLRVGLRTQDGWVEVVEGLAAGTPVVVENVSMLPTAIASPVETFPSAKAAPAAGKAGDAGGRPAGKPEGRPEPPTGTPPEGPAAPAGGASKKPDGAPSPPTPAPGAGK